MNVRRKAFILYTGLQRMLHRHGFGIQSPWAYELVRDVLYERLAYYAYEEQHLGTQQQRQLFRIQNYFRRHHVVIIDCTGVEAKAEYEQAMQHYKQDLVIVMDHTDDANARLWQYVVDDPHATVTFDMGRRGLVVCDSKRIKQNYLL